MNEPCKGCYLTTAELYRLDTAVRPLREIIDETDDYGGIYLVGSAGERPDFRDVDVRMILADTRFDALFGHSEMLWAQFCYAVSRSLSIDSGLRVDFQVQRMTEANDRYGGRPRNALGLGRARVFAGGGDATNFVVND